MALYDVVGYSFDADVYCPECVILEMIEEHNDAPYSGIEGAFNCASHYAADPEDNLDAMARAVGIDRDDERSFDSGDFPKVIFRDMIERALGEEDFCGRCYVTL